MKKDIPIAPGLKFKSRHFSAGAEIRSVKGDIVEIEMQPSDGNNYIHTTRLSHLKNQFNIGAYYLPDAGVEYHII